MGKRGDVYKRKNIWWCWVKTPSGHKRMSTGCRDKAAARLAKIRLEREYADPAYHAAHAATLAKAIERFVQDRVNMARAKGTIVMYRTQAGHMLRIIGDECRLIDITAGTLDDYIGQRRREKASHHTIHKELAMMSGVLRGAKRRGEFPADLGQIMPRFARRYVPRKAWLTPTQARQLVAALRPDRAATVAFVLACGARKGEWERARREDVNGCQVGLRGTKTPRSSRIVPVVHPEQVRFLRVAMRFGHQEGLLFDRWREGWRDIRRACTRIGMQPVSWNDLRRTFGSWLKQAGVPVEDIADMMGHASTQMVRAVYGRDTPTALEDRLRRTLASHGSVDQGSKSDKMTDDSEE